MIDVYRFILILSILLSTINNKLKNNYAINVINDLNLRKKIKIHSLFLPVNSDGVFLLSFESSY